MRFAILRSAGCAEGCIGAVPKGVFRDCSVATTGLVVDLFWSDEERRGEKGPGASPILNG